MKKTSYLNFILTVIAILLFGIFMNQSGLLPRAYASPDHNEIDVNLKSVNGYSLFGGKLKVEIDDEVNVRCMNCD